MTDVEEYFEDWHDGRAIARRLLSAMRDLRMADAVISRWGEASSQVCILRLDGSMSPTGRQSADYRCRSAAAMAGEGTDGAVSMWWDDGDWCVSVEDSDEEVMVQPHPDDEDADEEEDEAA